MNATPDPKHPGRMIVQGPLSEVRSVSRREYEEVRSKPKQPLPAERRMARREQVVRKPPTVIESICEASDEQLAPLVARLQPLMKCISKKSS